MLAAARRNKERLAALVAVAILGSLVFGCKYFPESTFELARESRLPKWFSLPPGLTRGDVSVTMNYYVRPSERTATFVLHDMKNHKIAETEGKLKGMKPLYLKDSRQGDASDYPSFEVITADGVTEVIEHKKMEPTFYIMDDPVVLKELMGVQSAKDPIISPK